MDIKDEVATHLRSRPLAEEVILIPYYDITVSFSNIPLNKMGWKQAIGFASLGLIPAQSHGYSPASLKMSCSQLVLDRIDP